MCLQHKGLILTMSIMSVMDWLQLCSITLGRALAKAYWFLTGEKEPLENHKMEFKESVQTRNMSLPLTFYWSRKAKCPNLISTK